MRLQENKLCRAFAALANTASGNAGINRQPFPIVRLIDQYVAQNALLQQMLSEVQLNEAHSTEAGSI